MKTSICRRDLRRDGESPEENGREGMRVNPGWEARVLGWPWSEGDVAKNTSEESKAGGNLRLKTPLSSRELNSNVRVPRGRDKWRRWKDTGERRRQMCAHF